MGEEEITLRLIWKIAALVTCTAIVSMSGCTMHENALIADMVAKGADPMKSLCAISPSYAERICPVVAAKMQP